MRKSAVRTLVVFVPPSFRGLKKPAGEKCPLVDVCRWVALATFFGCYGIDESDAAGAPYPVTLRQPWKTASEESSPKPMARYGLGGQMALVKPLLPSRDSLKRSEAGYAGRGAAVDSLDR